MYIFMMGLEQKRSQQRTEGKHTGVQALVHSSQEDEHHSTLHLDREAIAPAELKGILLCLSPDKELRLCFITALLLDCLSSVSAFLCSLKIIDY